MDNFFIRTFRRETTGQTPASPQEEPVAKGGSFSSECEVQVNSATAALSVAAFYRAMELRSNTMSQLVMEFQQKQRQSCGGNFVKYEGTKQGFDGVMLNYLLQLRPNPTMTWSQLMKQAEQLRVFQGNAVIYMERDESHNISAFWLASKAMMNTITHQYELLIQKPGGFVSLTEVDGSDVLHLRNTFSNDCGLTGVATLRYARAVLSLAATNDKLVTETAAKGMRQKLLVQETQQAGLGLGRANKKELQKITEQLDKDIANKDVIMLSNIAQVTPISTNLQQQEINALRSFSVREVARIMGVPAVMLMDDSNSSYKTPEAATQEFLLRTIQPLAHDWEQEMNAKILGPGLYGTYRFKFDDKSLMRLDPMGRANLDKVLVETGVKCVNELRADYDLPSVEGGDRHFISTNLQPVDNPTVGQQAQVQEGGVE